MTTNVPKPTFTDKGFIAPQESDVLAGVLQDFQEAFGGALNPSLETPQGQLASSEAAIIGNANDQFCNLTNQVDPAYASGRMQDAIARIYFIERNPAQATVVQALCSGLAGVIIPAGSLAVALDGNIYSCTQAGTIQLNGQVTLAFACTVTGPIACPASTLTGIYQAIPGWDSITNAADGVLGNDVETRSAFETRRALSVAGNSFGAIGSIIGAVSKVSGVLDYYGYDNATNGNVSINGHTVLANSIYIAAVGGTDLDVGTAIISKKAPGCSYTGNTTVTVYDNNPLYSAPIPYTVKFQRPTSLPIMFGVSLTNGPGVPSNAPALVQAAIQSAFAGNDGGSRARIGSTLYGSRYFAPIAALGPWVNIISLQLGSINTPSAIFTANVTGTTMWVSAVSSGNLGVGQTLFDTTGNLTQGTTILSQGNGSAGGVGNYTVSVSKSVTTETITSALATQNTVSVHIDQVPVTDNSLITVTLV